MNAPELGTRAVAGALPQLGAPGVARRPILGQDPVILNLNIGTGLKNLGRFRDAKPFLERCLRVSGVPPALGQGVGGGRSKAGALQMSPNKPNCAQALAFVNQQLGEA
jgi:hypothetical protein